MKGAGNSKILFYLLVLLVPITVSHAQADLKRGKEVVDQFCAGCHLPGVMGAPKLGSKDEWAPRAEKGEKALFGNAINGVNSMPAKGGNPALSDADIRHAVLYLLSQAGVKAAEKPAPKAVAKAEPAKQAAKPAETPKPAKAVTTAGVKKAGAASSINKFNRLMKSRSDWNPPPPMDGIHDPDNEGTHILQPPKEAFAGMPSNNFGNHVDWVKALNEGVIEPRYDRLDPTKKAFVMDLNIIREVKGSMPNVLYPHAQHTEWLDCSNCHPAIFVPKKGANNISMAGILMGEKCGVCHGKVAFPVSECRRCHSQKKAVNTATN